jgi:uncharacterized membrane protein YphA (DoxX/SURF4 family)
MPTSSILLFSAALAAIFTWAALAKIVGFSRWRAALAEYRLPASGVVAVGVPVSEGICVALLVAGRTRAGAALVLALVAAFSAAVIRAREQEGEKLPCGCFGGTGRRDYRTMLTRNATLVLLAGALMIEGRDVELLGRIGSPAASDVLPAVLAIIGVVVLAWFVYQTSTALRRGRSA